MRSDANRSAQPLASGAKPAETIELVVMHWSGEGGQEEDAIAEKLLRDFEDTHSGVRVRRINPGDAFSYYTKLQTMSAAGTPPDVFYVGSERVAALVEAGQLAPVDAAEDLSDFYPAVVDAFRYDGQATGRGQLWGIPKDFTTIGFYLNLDLFERAGITPPTGDWTWSEYVAAARKLGALESENGQPIYGSEFVTWPMMVRLYLRTYGLDLISPDFQKSRLGETEVFAALDRLRGWRHDEQRTLTTGKSKVATGASVFLTGRVGMAGPFGRWVVPSYRKIDDFRWDFVPMPHAAGQPPRNAVATVAWSVSSFSLHPTEAWQLARHLTGQESQALAAPLGLAVPARKSVAESRAFLNPEVPPFNDRAYLKAAETASAVAWPANPKFEDLVRTRLERALKTGDASLPEAIAELEAGWKTERESPLASDDLPPMPWALLLTILLVIGGTGFTVLAFFWWRRRPGTLELRQELGGYLLISPWLIGFLIFLAFPILLSFALSLSKWNGMSTLDHAQWAGLKNYSQLLGHDPRFLVSLKVTAYYALLAVPLGQAFALLAAMLMNLKLKGIGFFRGAWYLPSVLAGVGVAVLWSWVFDGDNGLLNAMLSWMSGGIDSLLIMFGLPEAGLSPPEWFGKDAGRWGAPAFALMNMWAVGGSMMIYLAGLKGIPQDLYEAAEIDGAGAWRRFRSVTLPMLSPVIFFNFIMAIIGSFQVFTQAFVMTGGEPGDLTRFYVLYLYNQAFDFYQMGYASAMAWLLLVLVLGLTLVVMRGSRRFVYYEALKS
jgi:multiple sugar transport system permease protein/multiple sugar transport system substrate-binding protein